MIHIECLARRRASLSVGSMLSTADDNSGIETAHNSPEVVCEDGSNNFDDPEDDEFWEPDTDEEQDAPVMAAVTSQDLIILEMRNKAIELRKLVSDDMFTKNGTFGKVDLSYRFNPRLVAKGETWIDNKFDLIEITEKLQDMTQAVRPIWDHDFIAGETISPTESVGENEYLATTWCAFKGRFGFPGRDFCWQQYTWIDDTKTEAIHIAASVPTGSEPEGYKPGQKGHYVRATTHIGGYKFSVVPDRGTHVVFFNQTDIGSNLPAWVTDSVLKKSPTKLEYFRKFITS